MHDLRARIVQVCEIAWDEGRDPARDIALIDERKAQLAAAKAIAGRGSRVAAEITPATTLEEALEHAEQTTGFAIAMEARLWHMLEERVARLEEATALVDDGNQPVVADGPDHCIWPYRDEHKRIRLAWISDYNFADRPTLFLDATAHVSIVERVLERSVVCRPIEAALRLHTTLIRDSTYTKRRFIRGDGTVDHQLLSKTRSMIAKVAAVHGDGGVVAVAPKSVETLMLDGWKAPANTDTMHYGNTAGFDWAKKHSSLLMIGAMYPNLETVDGYIAALTRNDPEPRIRMDPDGTGTRKELPFTVTIEQVRARDGSTVEVNRLSYPDPLADEILQLVRDEQLVQTMGRLRVIHRPDVPHLYILGTTIPTGVVIDRVVDKLEDELRDLGLLLAAAHQQGGIVSDEVAEKSDNIGQMRIFRREIENNPTFAKSFHRVDVTGAKSFWICGYVSNGKAAEIAGRAGGTLHLVSRREFDRPPPPREKPAPSPQAQAIIERREREKRFSIIPDRIRDRVASERKDPEDREAELERLAEVFRIDGERQRREHVASLPTVIETPFDNVSDDHVWTIPF